MVRNMGGQGKNEGAIFFLKTVDIVDYALEVSVNGGTCVSVIHFRHIFKFVNWLNS